MVLFPRFVEEENRQGQHDPRTHPLAAKVLRLMELIALDELLGGHVVLKVKAKKASGSSIAKSLGMVIPESLESLNPRTEELVFLLTPTMNQ